MRSAVIDNEKIVEKDIMKPELKGKGALIQVLGCGLCGSDIVKFQHKISKNGAVLGHEIVGKIVEIDTETDFKKGDKIVMGHHYPCFECVYCKGGNYSMCKTFKNSNIKPGGFSEFIVCDENHLKNTVFKVPDNLDNHEASFLEPLSCCIRAVRRAELKPNSKVLVIGLGSIGFLMGQAIKAYGHTVVGADLSEERLNLAKNNGFDYVVKSQDSIGTSEKIKSLTQEEGVDAVFMTSGSDKTFELCLKSIRNGGTILIFSSVPSDLAGFMNNEIYYRELKILGSYSPAPKDIAQSMEFLKSGKVKVKNISVEYPLNKVQQAIEDTLAHKIFKAYIKLWKWRQFNIME